MSLTPVSPTRRWIPSFAALAIAAAPAAADTRSLRDAASARIASRIMAGAALRIDVGLEVSMLGGATADGADTAIGADVVIAVFAPPPAPSRTSMSTSTRLRDRLRDRVLDRVLGPPPPRAWPALARPRLEIHAGGVFDLAGHRQQLHVSAGSGLGPLGIGVAGELEWNDAGAAWAIGPELRIRHRFGPRARSPSIGVVARGELFVDDRATHADRFTLGVYGMFDAF